MWNDTVRKQTESAFISGEPHSSGGLHPGEGLKRCLQIFFIHHYEANLCAISRTSILLRGSHDRMLHYAYAIAL